MKRSVLMGDPRHFSIRGGSNPHTRNQWGFKKKVDRDLAIQQWYHLAKTLTLLGINVYVIPAISDCPGLVYPANAGFLTKLDEPVLFNTKTFYLSCLIQSRKKEEIYYRKFLSGLGFRLDAFKLSMEGEADFFPWGSKYIFTHGHLKKQEFKLRWGWPPYQRVYGFRSDRRLFNDLRQIVDPCDVLSLKLINESHYHGDTVMSAFGPNRNYLLVWKDGLDLDSQKIMKHFDEGQIVYLSDHDRILYAANSFQVKVDGKFYLFMPEGVSESLINQIEALDVQVILINVSEFLKKGGGSIKCMIGDLGMIDIHTISDAKVLNFHQENLFII